jgi:hypothetical protein
MQKSNAKVKCKSQMQKSNAIRYLLLICATFMNHLVANSSEPVNQPTPLMNPRNGDIQPKADLLVKPKNLVQADTLGDRARYSEFKQLDKLIIKNEDFNSNYQIENHPLKDASESVKAKNKIIQIPIPKSNKERTLNTISVVNTTRVNDKNDQMVILDLNDSNSGSSKKTIEQSIQKQTSQNDRVLQNQQSVLNTPQSKKVYFLLGAGTQPTFKFRFVSTEKNSFEIHYSQINAMLTNYGEVASLNGNIGSVNLNASINLGYEYDFMNKQLGLGIVRMLHDNIGLAAGINFNSTVHHLKIYANLPVNIGNMNATPINYENNNEVNLNNTSVYLGLQLESDPNHFGLSYWGSLGIDYAPANNYESIKKIMNKSLTTADIYADLDKFKYEIAKYRINNNYTAGIKYKF